VLFFLQRALIATVTADGNVTAEYIKAGLQVVLSEKLLNHDPAQCDQACLKAAIEDTVAVAGWKGWMVSAYTLYYECLLSKVG